MFAHFAFSSARDVGKLGGEKGWPDFLYGQMKNFSFIKIIFGFLCFSRSCFLQHFFIIMQEHRDLNSSMLIYPER